MQQQICLIFLHRISRFYQNYLSVFVHSFLTTITFTSSSPLYYPSITPRRMTSAMLSSDILYNQLLASMSGKSLLLGGGNEFHPCCKCGATFGDAKSLTVSIVYFYSFLQWEYPLWVIHGNLLKTWWTLDV